MAPAVFNAVTDATECWRCRAHEKSAEIREAPYDKQDPDTATFFEKVSVRERD